MIIKHEICVGKDTGIASNGWAILNNEAQTVCAAGSRLFDAPETDKERKPTNQIRQEKRSLRRIISRKSGRLSQVRHLCFEYGLTQSHDKNLFQTLLHEINHSPGKATVDQQGITPWSLRADALQRSLSGEELAVILGHIAKHAGFQSNRKGGEKNAAGDDQKALKAMEGLAEKIGPYRTFGDAIQRDPALSIRKRNRDGIYDRTPKRAWLRAEIAIIFDSQRKFENEQATKELEDAYCAIAFTRKPLQDSEHLVRFCPFEEGEKRASKFSPSFERFRLLQSLVHLRIDDPAREHDHLSTQEIALIETEFGKTLKLTFKKIRGLLRLSDKGVFRNLPSGEKERQEAEKRDIAARKKNGAQGTHALKKALKEHYDTLTDEQLDEAMAKIAFRETSESIETGLKQLNLTNQTISLLMAAVEDNAFHFATGAAHISARACRNIIPSMREGYVYSEACEKFGYDHVAPKMSPFVRLRHDLQGATLTEKRKAVIAILADKDNSPINSPVARKAVIETVKQFVTLCHEHPALAGALPGQVNIELAREMGKSPEERSKLASGLERRNRETDKLAKQFKNTFGHSPRKGELRVYELAQEQNWRCLYTDDPIDPKKLFDGTSYQVDHILPWSRFGDNSYVNLTLCTAWANQNKKDRTPYEWMSEDGLDWESYIARIDARPGPREPDGMKGIKKRNYLLKNANEKGKEFRTRNLNDTKWAAKVILQAIEALYPIELNENGNPIRRVRARPGAVTSLLRRGWGLESLKKDKDGVRVQDDRHHALDAIIVAAASESMLNQLTKAVQKAESLGKPRHFERLDLPWPDFRNQVKNALADITCSRAERRRARGKGHEETIRSYVRESNLVCIRQTPEDIIKGLAKKADGNPEMLEALLADKFERPERSKKIIQSIADWALKGTPQDAPPLGPTGDPIRKVRVIQTGGKPAVMLDEKATADRGEIVRVDVFSKPDKKGRKKFYLVPIYPHQVMNKRDYPAPPDRAIVASKPESEWEQITDAHDFKFSLYPLCWIEATTSKGEIIEGYYRTTDRSTGAIEISPHYSLQQKHRGIGARSLLSFKKFSVDRLGNLSEIKGEIRTWRGAACISATRRD